MALVVVERRGARVGWAVVAANGRLLGRSVATYRTAADLAAAFRELLADRRSLRITVGRDEGALTWSWTASLPSSRAVARSGRGYLRHDQCRAGAAGFLEALEGALEGIPPPPPGAGPGRPGADGRPASDEGPAFSR